MANHNQGSTPGGNQRSGTSNRGFASMDERQQREIARLGGEAVSGNREHMAAIGRKGGEASAESRQNARARLNASNPSDENAAQRGDTPSGGRNNPGARTNDDTADRNLGGRARNDDDGNRRGMSGRSRSDDDNSH